MKDETRAKRAALAEPASGWAWGVVVVATLGMSVSYVDRQTLAAIAPAVTKALAIDNTQYGWLISAFSISYLIGTPIAGAVVDRLGARRGFAVAVLLWSIIAGAHALATSFAGLFVLRVLLGSAEAPSFPAAAQAIRRVMPGARRALALGFLFTGSSIGAVVAGKLAVRLEAAHGFRATFVVTAMLGTLWIPAWLLVTHRFGGARAFGPAETGAGAAARAIAQASTFDVLKSAPVLRAVVLVFGSAPALMFVLNWTAKYLVDAWKIPKGDVGNYLIAAPLLFDVGAVGFGWLASARGEQHASGKTHADLFLVSMALAAAIAFAPLAGSPEAAIALFAASACGGGGLYALVTADMLSRVPVERTSTAGGTTAAAQAMGHVVASPLVGWTVDRTHSYGAALVGLGLIVVPTTLAFVLWPMPSSAPSPRR